MCTVTYIPQKNGMILTSNRDEHISRGIALYPEFYQLNDKKLAFPKDSKAGGTWFISNEQGDAGVLLNGAFEKHIPQPTYRKSRGWLLPEIFQTPVPIPVIDGIQFGGHRKFHHYFICAAKINRNKMGWYKIIYNKSQSVGSAYMVIGNLILRKNDP